MPNSENMENGQVELLKENAAKSHKEREALLEHKVSVGCGYTIGLEYKVSVGCGYKKNAIGLEGSFHF